jgi:DNA-binding transcriptional LysR family regulator
MRPDVRQLQHVAAIGQHRSFGRAAHALGMSQPALSKSIRLLEAELGVRLFERGKGGATPTAFGQLVLARGRPLIRSLDALLVEIDNQRGLTTGSLSVGAGFFPYLLHVIPAVGRLARAHPGLHLRIAQADWRTVAHQVLAGAFDVGVTGVARAALDPALLVEPLTTRLATFFVRRGHPLSGAARLSLKDLAPYPFAMGTVPPRLAPFFVRAGIKGRVDSSTGDFIPAIAVDSVALMKSIVGDTDAFGAAPDAAIGPELETGQLVALPIQAPWAVAEPCIVRLRDRPLTPAQETFLAELRAIDREADARPQGPARSRPASPTSSTRGAASRRR